MTELEAEALAKNLLKEMREEPPADTKENYPFHGSLFPEESEYTPEFLMEIMEAIAEHERMEKWIIP